MGCRLSQSAYRNKETGVTEQCRDYVGPPVLVHSPGGAVPLPDPILSTMTFSGNVISYA